MKRETTTETTTTITHDSDLVFAREILHDHGYKKIEVFYRETPSQNWMELFAISLDDDCEDIESLCLNIADTLEAIVSEGNGNEQHT